MNETTNELSGRRLRIFELVLVLGISFAPSVVLSIYVLLFHVNIDTGMERFTWLRISDLIFRELAGLAVMGYVLFRQGRTFRDIGVAFEWRDIGRSVVICLIAGMLCSVAMWELRLAAYYGLGRSLDAQAHNVGFLTQTHVPGMLPLLLLLATINPFAEELTVRGYFMTEILALARRPWLAVLLSVVVQDLYHLYQGVIPALSYLPMFATFAIYYLRSGRILPVVLAHLYMDVGAMLFAAAGHR